MLIVTRKPGESIVIDDAVTLTVSEVRGCRVKIAIDAPRSINVVRKEIAGNLPRLAEVDWNLIEQCLVECLGRGNRPNKELNIRGQLESVRARLSET